ncbi:uncharacterized protein LOC8081190 [Sorghum bicolor]|uniref:KIB1-4 beta-propeller domain-containing protein n=1 Tax=Sorghum bicolor TaxID=4558 RepID=A0A1B6Q9F0_SORBI|nr:uncharacterized protein LOC8081190 [Sorghum bicolor]KXG34511.1 hypothetical protein SORBI_3002G051500 [Sorghum bicolor]|eukprot:XP_021308596.1 uncharacterized protein LOC8081190 [Sorghum bicolor]
MAAGALRQGASSHRGGGGGGKEAMPCWASLHIDVTQLIAARVLATGGFLDYVRFRAVCSGWRAAAASPRGRGLLDPRLHPRRWMLFPEGFGQHPGHPAHGGHTRFFDVSAAGAFVRVPIPELEDHHVLDSPDGLLLLVRFEDTALRLLHPFTRDVADLPSFHCLAQQVRHLEELPDRVRLLDADVFYFYGTLSRELCSAVNITASGTITVMLALAPIGRVAVASAGDDQWTISSWALEEKELEGDPAVSGEAVCGESERRANTCLSD